jgi:hypothetical protein
MPDGMLVQITVKGRVGPSLCSVAPALDVRVVPRHHVLVVPSDPGRDPLRVFAVLAVLEQRGIEVDRITG